MCCVNIYMRMDDDVNISWIVPHQCTLFGLPILCSIYWRLLSFLQLFHACQSVSMNINVYIPYILPISLLWCLHMCVHSMSHSISYKDLCTLTSVECCSITICMCVVYYLSSCAKVQLSPLCTCPLLVRLHIHHVVTAGHMWSYVLAKFICILTMCPSLWICLHMSLHFHTLCLLVHKVTCSCSVMWCVWCRDVASSCVNVSTLQCVIFSHSFSLISPCTDHSLLPNDTDLVSDQGNLRQFHLITNIRS